MIKVKDAKQFGRGLLMGGADIIPGVSGGTVALILGIYQRLVTAISRFDGTLIKLLAGRQWRAAAERVDLRFLSFLALGILTGGVTLAKTMRFLLTNHRGYTLAVFFGLILASSILVSRLVGANTPKERFRAGALALAGAVFAFYLVGLEQVHLYDHPAYYFLCGCLAICAMILPGISGAYILWLLGAYEAVTGFIVRAVHFELSGSDLASVVAFGCGCVVGLISFSKILRRLLTVAHSTTLAVLGGFMIGSLRGLWPFQRLLNPEETELRLRRYESLMPDAMTTEVAITIGLVVLAAAALLLLERSAGGIRSPQQPGESGE